MIGFPLLLIPLAIYNIIVFLMPGVSFGTPLVTVPLTSGASWVMTLSDALLAFGLLLLVFEIIKSTRPVGKYVTDHLLALLLFAGAVAEFVMLPQFANSTFFLLTMLALVDFVSGISLRARRPRALREAEAPARTSVASARVHEVQVPVPVGSTPSVPPIVAARPVESNVVEAGRAPVPLPSAKSMPPSSEPIFDVPENVAETEREPRTENRPTPGHAPPAS